MKRFSALIAGLFFGLGLAASGMTDTRKVIGFLNVFGNWDPDLLFVMGAAVLTSFLGFKQVLKTQQKPLYSGFFELPTRTDIDSKLVLGASLFGVGWGLYGYCPGPAIAAMVYLEPVTFYFIFAMIVGMKIGKTVS